MLPLDKQGVVQQLFSGEPSHGLSTAPQTARPSLSAVLDAFSSLLSLPIHLDFLSSVIRSSSLF